MANVIDVIKSKNLAEYIPELLPQTDGTYRGRCPIHHGNNETAFVVFPDNKFYCFSCHASGDIIDYKILKDKIPFDVAVQEIAEDFGINIDENFVKEKSLIEQKEYQSKNFAKHIEPVYRYLRYSRGLSDDTIKKFRLGYGIKKEKTETKKAVVIPMFDKYNRVVNFGYRFFEGSPKYKNGANSEIFEKGKYLYGINFAIERLKTTNTLYVCEGFFDVMSADEQGLACVAYCGITFNQHHVALIKSVIGQREIKVVLVPDNDNKADKFIGRGRLFFKQLYPKCEVYVMQIRNGYKDLNDLHVANLKIADEKQLPIEIYLITFILKNNTEYTQKQKVLELTQTIKDPLIKLDIAQMLSNNWNKPLEVVKEFLSVQKESVDEIVNDFADLNMCASELLKISEEPIHFGYKGLDDTLDMFKKQITCIVAASNMGKTDFLIEVLLNIVLVQKRTAIFFSLEMSKQDVAKIILAKLLQMPRHLIKDFIIDNPVQAMDYIEKIGRKLLIVDKVMNLDEIDEYIKIAKTRVLDGQVLDVVAIDHFGLMKNNSTVEEQSKNGDKAIKIAKDNNICLIMVAQLNKSSQTLEKGRIREVMLTDISGSASLGNACTNVLALWRPEKNPSLGEIDKEKWKNISRLKIVKYREKKSEELYFQYKYEPMTSRLAEMV